MKIDKKSLECLLTLNDDQLRAVLRGLLKEYGIDPSGIPLEQFNMSQLRAALSGATDEDVQRFASMISGMGGGRREGRGHHE